MAISPDTSAPHRTHSWVGFRSILARFASSAKAKAGTMLRTLQEGRMMSTLSNMTDHQLDQIGISRDEIPSYAKTLISEG